MRNAALGLTALALGLGCAEVAPDPREAAIVNAFVEADLPLLRARPALVAGRYARMASSPYDFYRGALPLFLRDWRDGTISLSRSDFGVDWPMPHGLGDPHPENFGTLLARDGTLSLEANDLDGADRVPYLWDLRRLTVGLCLAARLANAPGSAARAQTEAAAGELAAVAASSYAQTLARLVQGETLPAVRDGASSALLADLFRRARRDAGRREELSQLTTLRDGARALRRGVLDADDPNNVLVSLPSWAREALPSALRGYAGALREPPAERFFTVLDAARELGSGVASWPRVRILVLVRGASDDPGDDVILELKEQGDSVTPGSLPPARWWNTVPERVLASRRLWSVEAADPLWGATMWLGIPVQIRAEREAHKTLRVERMTGAEGSVDSLRGVAVTLGAYLARAHHRPTDDGRRASVTIAATIARDPDGFAQEQSRRSNEYAQRVLDDWQRFRRALAQRGPTLGIPAVDEERSRDDLRALFAIDQIPEDGGRP